MFLIVLFTIIHNILISEDMEQPKCPFMNEKKMWHLHTQKYYSVMKMKESLPSEMQWVLSEMNQTKGNTAWNHLYVGSVNQYKAEPIETVEKWLPGAAR